MPDLTLAEVSYLTDVGNVRQSNQDTVIFHCPEDTDVLRSHGVLCVVADGMGGFSYGEVASRMAADVTLEQYYATSPRNAAKTLEAAVQTANLRIYQAVHSNGYGQMGSTVTVAAITEGKLTIAHVGDSRAYLLHQGQMNQLTNDHSLVGEMVRMRLITPDQARTHPDRNVLNRSLGMGPLVSPDTSTHPVQTGDILVLCSDGLWCEVPEADIKRIVSVSPPATACSRLVELAKWSGGSDNIGVLVARIVADENGTPAAPARKRFWWWS